MKRTIKRISSVNGTGAELARLVMQYNDDVAFADSWDFGRFYDYVKRLPYIEDMLGTECISRPAIALSSKAQFRDCDDKACAIGAYLYRRNIKFRFVACSYKKQDPIHHCVVQLGKNAQLRDGTDLEGVIVDATYAKDEFPPQKPYYNITAISRWL
jgi:hypothetical protein